MQLDFFAKRKLHHVTLYEINPPPQPRISPQVRGCQVQFQKVRDNSAQIYQIVFESRQKDAEQFAFPVHDKMEMVVFDLKKSKKSITCFEWIMDASGARIGCSVPSEEASQFVDCFDYCMGKIVTETRLRQSWTWLQQIPDYDSVQSNQQIPQSQKVYKEQSAENTRFSSGWQQKSYPDLDTNPSFQFMQTNHYLNQPANSSIQRLLVRLIDSPSSKFVHIASLHEILLQNDFREFQERQLLQKQVIFVIVDNSKFIYEIQLLSADGDIVLKKALDLKLIVTVSVEGTCVKWINMAHQIIQVNFNGNADATLSADFAIKQCLYELAHKKKLKDVIEADQLNYNTEDDQKVESKPKQKINTKPLSTDVSWLCSKVQDTDRTFAQGKINSILLTGSNSTLQVLNLDTEQTNIKLINESKIPCVSQYASPNLSKILFYEEEDKAILMTSSGTVHAYDIAENKIIKNNMCHNASLLDICSGKQINNQHRTFKGAYTNKLYEIDPRCAQSIVNTIQYKTYPQFSTISTDATGRYACGSSNGEIRLYRSQLNKKATCKYPGLGDPITHTQCSRDGTLLLATCRTYIILLPTSVNGRNLYDSMLNISKRPKPIKLTIKQEHVILCQKDRGYLSLIPAKFSQYASQNQKQTHIVSGYGKYIFIWNVKQTLQSGQGSSYKLVQMGEEDEQICKAEFCYNNISKIILAMNSGMHLKSDKF